MRQRDLSDRVGLGKWSLAKGWRVQNELTLAQTSSRTCAATIRKITSFPHDTGIIDNLEPKVRRPDMTNQRQILRNCDDLPKRHRSCFIRMWIGEPCLVCWAVQLTQHVLRLSRRNLSGHTRMLHGHMGGFVKLWNIARQDLAQRARPLKAPF